VEPGSDLITLQNFLKMVEEPKRKSYFSEKSVIPLHIMESEEIDQAGGYLAVFKQRY